VITTRFPTHAVAVADVDIPAEVLAELLAELLEQGGQPPEPQIRVAFTAGLVQPGNQLLPLQRFETDLDATVAIEIGEELAARGRAALGIQDGEQPGRPVDLAIARTGADVERVAAAAKATGSLRA
jgi:hypothetical protein